MGSRDEVAHNLSVDHSADAAHAVVTLCNEAFERMDQPQSPYPGSHPPPAEPQTMLLEQESPCD